MSTETNNPVPSQEPTTPAQPPKGEEFKGMSLEQFNERLAKERAAGMKELLGSLGLKSPDELKGILEENRKERESKLTEKQRLELQLKELAPYKEKAESLSSKLKGYHDRVMESLSEADRAKVERLAPKDIEGRLEWIELARTEKILGVTVAPETKSVDTKPATTLAGTSPSTSAVTPSKWQQYQKLMSEGKTLAAANFYNAHKRAIESSRPK